MTSAAKKTIIKKVSRKNPRNVTISASKVVHVDVFFLHTQVFKHVKGRLRHNGRSTHIVLDILGGRMIFEVVVVEYLVDESRWSLPVVFW